MVHAMPIAAPIQPDIVPTCDFDISVKIRNQRSGIAGPKAMPWIILPAINIGNDGARASIKAPTQKRIAHTNSIFCAAIFFKRYAEAAAVMALVIMNPEINHCVDPIDTEKS